MVVIDLQLKMIGPLAKEQKMKWLERLEIVDDAAKEAISNESFGMNCRNIVQWRLDIENEDIQGIIDPSLEDEYDI
nr:probable LRR receptor-like serine/threonine-protein kinase At1g67720 isoform X1 [Tanacetum cinerariifolium]